MIACHGDRLAHLIPHIQRFISTRYDTSPARASVVKSLLQREPFTARIRTSVCEGWAMIFQEVTESWHL
jgi:hypothetical protein